MTLHSKISYVKSLIRILAAASVFPHVYIQRYTLALLVFAGGMLLAELLGIVEEAIPGAYKGTETTGTYNRGPFKHIPGAYKGTATGADS